MMYIYFSVYSDIHKIAENISTTIAVTKTVFANSAIESEVLATKCIYSLGSRSRRKDVP